MNPNLEIGKYLASRSKRINQVLSDFLNKQQNKYGDVKLLQAIKYSLLNGGKRIRPILVYATSESFNTPLEFLDAPAAAIELIHSCSLIHDDLPAMDNDAFRRGQPTCHKKFDEATAILAGDSLAILPFELLSQDTNIDSKKKLQMIDVLSNCTMQMIVGQSIDMEIFSPEKAKKVTITELENMYLLKTGALLSAAVKLGALASLDPTNDKKIDQLEIFAKNLGLAFQIQDDIFDLENTSDKKENKPTYPILAGLENAKIKVAELQESSLNMDADTSLLNLIANYIFQRKY